jgi:hypothetical protein
MVCLTPKDQLETSLLDVSEIDKTSLPSFALIVGSWKLETSGDLLRDAAMLDDGLA